MPIKIIWVLYCRAPSDMDGPVIMKNHAERIESAGLKSYNNNKSVL